VPPGEDAPPKTLKIDLAGLVSIATLIVGVATTAEGPTAKLTACLLLAVGGSFLFAGLHLKHKILKGASWLLSVIAIFVAIWVTLASDDDGADHTASGTGSSTRTTDTTSPSTTPSSTPSGSLAPSSTSATPPPAPLSEPEEGEIGANGSHDFFSGSLFVGVADVYSSWGRLNISTDRASCQGASMEVGERAFLQGEIDGAEAWFRITVTEVQPDTSVKVRVEHLVPEGDFSGRCPL
jgi:hypothetical protein